MKVITKRLSSEELAAILFKPGTEPSTKPAWVLEGLLINKIFISIQMILWSGEDTICDFLLIGWVQF